MEPADSIDMAAMFGKDTPELKSCQGVLGSSFFLHDQMDVNSPAANGDQKTDAQPKSNQVSMR
jgi:hypothetical protein